MCSIGVKRHSLHPPKSTKKKTRRTDSLVGERKFLESRKIRIGLPLSQETTSGMRDRFKNAPQEYGGKHRCQERALSAARPPSMSRGQPGETMAEKR